MDKVKITVFADPVCTWCWGSVPVVRALAYRYGERLEFDYIMGGMIEDIFSYGNNHLSAGGDVALSNRKIHERWLEASAIHGLPVCQSGFHLFSEERRSTLPQNYAYITAKIYVTENRLTMPANTHLHFLRRLQEATAVNALLTNRTPRRSSGTSERNNLDLERVILRGVNPSALISSERFVSRERQSLREIIRSVPPQRFSRQILTPPRLLSVFTIPR